MTIKLPKIFLDSGNPEETKRAKGLLGHLEGQTTNPSLVAKHPEVLKFKESGKTFTEKDLLKFYKDIIKEIDKQIAGSISVEVYSDWETTSAKMLSQAHDMYSWGKYIHIKFPTTPEGLKAGHEFSHEGRRINMTLVFDQQQAASVYAATIGTKENHFVSPFIGRWDDREINGLDLVKNIMRMYKEYNKRLNKNKPNLSVLAASIRSLEHLYACIFMGADIITIPFKIIQAWIHEERWMPDEHYRIISPGLRSIPYQNIPFQTNYQSFKVEKIDGDLLDEGLKKFADDWNKLIT